MPTDYATMTIAEATMEATTKRIVFDNLDARLDNDRTVLDESIDDIVIDMLAYCEDVQGMEIDQFKPHVDAWTKSKPEERLTARLLVESIPH